jgi:alkylated DNA repair protein (DNA oxidative demethylase)
VTFDLFTGPRPDVRLGPGAVVLPGFALDVESQLLSALDDVIAASPFRHMITPGGYRMSVAMTNCGSLGWVTDRSGYRYDPVDPESGRRWPAMLDAFLDLACRAADRANFSGFIPDACLINRYEPGAKLSLHQDKDEQDFAAPIVSVSLGLPARFQWGGMRRMDPVERVPLDHGDVMVWGGPDRLRYHGVMAIKAGTHPLIGAYRINLTFRKAG